jgi:hypothetical protein
MDNAKFNSRANGSDGKQHLSRKDVTRVLAETFDVEQLRRIAVHKASQIRDDAANRIQRSNSFHEVLAVLRSLPLTQSECDRAAKRLQNTWDYFQNGEWDPGLYELDKLEESIKTPFGVERISLLVSIIN